MYPVSPVATPWSMMSAFNVGSMSEAIDCPSWNTITSVTSGHAGAR